MLEFDGIKYKTEAEYQEAIRDKKIIDELKLKYDMSTKAGVTGIYRELQMLTLDSALGRKFDDEIFDLYTAYKNGDLTDEPVVSSGKKNKKNTVLKKEEKRKESSETKKEKKTGKTVSKDKTVTEIPLDPQLEKAVRRELKKQARRRNILIAVLCLISVGCLGYFGNYMIMAKAAEKEASELSALKDNTNASFISVEQVLKKEYTEEIVIPEILDEYKILYNKNKSLIGWIKIADTKIDYPVMQTVNNEYYLKHNFEQKEDANGCIFMDANCDVILGNDNWIIYGHHMKSGKMFGSLVKYANQDFYEKHKYIEFDTIYEKGTYEVMYVFRSRIFSSDEITFKYYQFIDANSETEFNSAMEEMAEMSLYDTGVTAHYGDQLLTLSTCDYQETNGRFAVVARKID